MPDNDSNSGDVGSWDQPLIIAEPDVQVIQSCFLKLPFLILFLVN
jgi:hypothetical protein